MTIRRILALFLSLAVTSFVQGADAPKSHKVEATKDLPYYEGEGADKVKHKLDLYLPKDHKDYPVLFFVHGGAWIHGDKNQLGIYSSLAESFARQGIGTVVTNYRLSPAVQHPEHVKDVARAFAWTHKNIKKYGGRPDQLFVSGHSAGGHLVSLLLADESYLKAEGCSCKDVRGAIPISGVYTIPDKLFNSIFGKEEEDRKKASPITHTHAGMPPFLIIYADGDFPKCDEMSLDFCKALKTKKCTAETLEIKGRNHISIIMKTGQETDPCHEAMLKFITTHTK